MQQSIVTKYLGPTNTRGSRIKATAYAGSVTIGYDSSLTVAENYRQAAEALISKCDWPTDNWISGLAPDGSDFVFVRAS